MGGRLCRCGNLIEDEALHPNALLVLQTQEAAARQRLRAEWGRTAVGLKRQAPLVAAAATPRAEVESDGAEHSPAFALTQSQRVQHVFSAFDEDGDGVLSFHELRAWGVVCQQVLLAREDFTELCADLRAGPEGVNADQLYGWYDAHEARILEAHYAAAQAVAAHKAPTPAATPLPHRPESGAPRLPSGRFVTPPLSPVDVIDLHEAVVHIRHDFPQGGSGVAAARRWVLGGLRAVQIALHRYDAAGGNRVLRAVAGWVDVEGGCALSPSLLYKPGPRCPVTRREGSGGRRQGLVCGASLSDVSDMALSVSEDSVDGVPLALKGVSYAGSEWSVSVYSKSNLASPASNCSVSPCVEQDGARSLHTSPSPAAAARDTRSMSSSGTEATGGTGMTFSQTLPPSYTTLFCNPTTSLDPLPAAAGSPARRSPAATTVSASPPPRGAHTPSPSPVAPPAYMDADTPPPAVVGDASPVKGPTPPRRARSLGRGVWTPPEPPGSMSPVPGRGSSASRGVTEEDASSASLPRGEVQDVQMHSPCVVAPAAEADNQILDPSASSHVDGADVQVREEAVDDLDEHEHEHAQRAEAAEAAPPATTTVLLVKLPVHSSPSHPYRGDGVQRYLTVCPDDGGALRAAAAPDPGQRVAGARHQLTSRKTAGTPRGGGLGGGMGVFAEPHPEVAAGEEYRWVFEGEGGTEEQQQQEQHAPVRASISWAPPADPTARRYLTLDNAVPRPQVPGSLFVGTTPVRARRAVFTITPVGGDAAARGVYLHTPRPGSVQDVYLTVVHQVGADQRDRQGVMWVVAQEWAQEHGVWAMVPPGDVRPQHVQSEDGPLLQDVDDAALPPPPPPYPAPRASAGGGKAARSRGRRKAKAAPSGPRVHSAPPSKVATLNLRGVQGAEAAGGSARLGSGRLPKQRRGVVAP
eukprot:TRINITY_DN30008_c0_g1_i1.p1 TRINITY_DN30008_c0_g1~~TRINITY_DN30008_c0_g1_i1.p1  ORF type:complete len:921 (+),score=227.39 TRINITY_DN30008_c0_g1_i1:93-2855(+)